MILPEPVLAPSEWVAGWASRIRRGGRVLDLACGSGRHTHFLVRAGFRVEAVDRDAAALALLAGLPGVTALQSDLESEPWPYEANEFDGIVVTNYLHRPLFPRLLESLAAGGVLIYETFAAGQEALGRPRNPEYLLKPGELLATVNNRLEVNAYEEVCVIQPRRAVVQRICAARTA